MGTCGIRADRMGVGGWHEYIFQEILIDFMIRLVFDSIGRCICFVMSSAS